MVAILNENVENGIDSDIVDSSPDNWLDLQFNYDLDTEGVFDNNESTNTFVYMARTGGSKDEEENNNSDEFQERLRPNTTPSSNDTIIDTRNRTFVNVDPISDTQILNHALLRSSMRIKKGHVDNSIEHYDALWCKFREIRIYNLVDYSRVRALGSINLRLSNSKLPQIFTSTIEFVNEETIIAQ